MRPDGLPAFARAILNPDDDLPAGIIDPNGSPAPKRFAVYRNNVTISLIEALGATFASVRTLVGEVFFNEMARGFVRQSPPQSPLLKDYGAQFPQFIADFEPAKNLPFLADVAKLDRAWLNAYHAADAEPVPAHEFAKIKPEKLADIRLERMPATHVIQSDFPIASVWSAARENRPAAGIDPAQAETALVTRPDVTVRVMGCTPATGVFFKELIDAKTLGEAAGAGAAFEKFELNEALALTISAGAFCKILTGDTQK